MEVFTNLLGLKSIISVLLTLAIYFASFRLYRKVANIWWSQICFHPLITSTSLIILLLQLSSISISEYQSNTVLLSLLLGPATVALAVPLYKYSRLLRAMSWRVIVPIIFSGIITPLFSWLCLYWLDTPLNLQMTVLVKSVTTPLAMDVAETIGGVAALAAVVVVTSGIVGAVLGPSLFALLKIRNEAAQGVALGSISHAIGTARAFTISEQCAAFSSLAFCVNSVATALILPVLFS